MGETKEEREIREQKMYGGSGKVGYICPFCGHITYKKSILPTLKEVDNWLFGFKCNICHKRTKIKTQDTNLYKKNKLANISQKNTIL